MADTQAPPLDEAPPSYGSFAGSLLGPATIPRPATMDAGPATQRSAAALEDRKAAAETMAQSQERAGEEDRAAARGVEAQSVADRAERQAARPASLSLPPAPETAARAFLTPPKGILDSLQTVMAAVGALGMQVKGATKGGSASAAILSMQAMADGWIKGDNERVKAEYTKWKAESERLIEEHRAKRESYQDLLADQTMSMNERLQAIDLRARASGHQTLAEQARVGNIDATLKQLQHDEGIELSIAQFNAQTAQWWASEQNRERNFQEARDQTRLLNEHRMREEKRHAVNDALIQEARADSIRHRGVQERRMAGNDALKREMAKPFLDMQTKLVNNMQVLDDVNMAEQMVKRLADGGMLQTTPSLWNEIGAKFNQRFSDDPALKEAIDWMQKLGTPLLARAEIAAGLPVSAMRLKVEAEPLIGHILTASPQFWSDFFARTRAGVERNNGVLRKNLQAVNPGLLQRIDQIDAPTLAPPTDDEWDRANASR